jgi:hypothetical protein
MTTSAEPATAGPLGLDGTSRSRSARFALVPAHFGSKKPHTSSASRSTEANVSASLLDDCKDDRPVTACVGYP